MNLSCQKMTIWHHISYHSIVGADSWYHNTDDIIVMIVWNHNDYDYGVMILYVKLPCNLTWPIIFITGIWSMIWYAWFLFFNQGVSQPCAGLCYAGLCCLNVGWFLFSLATAESVQMQALLVHPKRYSSRSSSIYPNSRSSCLIISSWPPYTGCLASSWTGFKPGSHLVCTELTEPRLLLVMQRWDFARPLALLSHAPWE